MSQVTTKRKRLAICDCMCVECPHYEAAEAASKDSASPSHDEDPALAWEPVRRVSSDLFADEPSTANCKSNDGSGVIVSTPPLFITPKDLRDYGLTDAQDSGDPNFIYVVSQEVLPLQSEGPQACSFGINSTLSQQCSPLPYYELGNLSKDESVALVWASGKWKAANLSTICKNHYDELFGDIQPLPESDRHKKCTDPFKNTPKKHVKNITADIRKVTFLFALKAKARGFVIPALQYICSNCVKAILKLPEMTEASPSQSSIESVKLPSDQESEVSVTFQKIDAEINLKGLGIEPTPVLRKSKECRIDEAVKVLKEKQDKFLNNVCLIFDVTPEDVSDKQNFLPAEYEELLSKVRDKILCAKNKEKLSLLTLCPSSWSERYSASYFGVSRYFIRKARELKEKKGILSEAEFFPRKLIPDTSRELAVAFFCSSENARILPGMKDKVSISKGKYMQKILILANLKEMYQLFKEEHPSVKMGLSLFCSLRPKWCVLAGTAGTHNVCVCRIHQNMKLLLHALPVTEDYRQLIKYFVCDPENRQCMLRLCPHCPKLAEIVDILTRKITEVLGIDEEEPEEQIEEILSNRIEYQEWASTDRSQLTTCLAPMKEVIDITASKFRELIPHDFINVKQKEYMKNLKENLLPKTAIILMDFSMNYSCDLQDATQSYHWSKPQATVHPAVIYFRNSANSELKHKSICFISEDIVHDTVQVSLAQMHLTQYLKTSHPDVEEVEYFTDGCAGQYKNCKSFVNLCRHEEMYGLKARWNFFATSHGKSPCDGVGGTVKREAARASLQRPLKDQITNGRKLYEFCTLKLSEKIDFIFLEKEELVAKRAEQDHLNFKPTSVPGTRSFHCFFPVSGLTIACKRFSSDVEVALVHRLTNTEAPSIVKEGDFALVKIDQAFSIGFITDLSNEEREAEVSLLYPEVPSDIYTWPEEVLNFFVPYPHILMGVELLELPENCYKLEEYCKEKVNLMIRAK